MTLASGMMSLSSEPHFGFGNMFRFRVFFFLNVRKSISYAGMQPSERKRKGCKASRKGCKRVLHTKGDSDTLMAARSQPNDNWGSVGNGAKHGEKHVGGGSGM